MDIKNFEEQFYSLMEFAKNKHHPLVMIYGEPKIGKNVYIGPFSEVYSKGALVSIGDNCDIASFVSINCADSHRLCINLSQEIDKKNIIIEHNVFIGSHSFVKGGVHIGHHSVVAAGTIVDCVKIPPYSLVIGNPMIIKEGYYAKFFKLDTTQ